MAHEICELLWLKGLLQDIGVAVQPPMIHFIKEKLEAGLICVSYVKSTDELADVVTKELSGKGEYLASVTKSGCLTIHDFETLYCLSSGLSPCLEEDETKHLLHLSTHQLDVVRWNPANQDEVACTSMQSNEVLLFDIGYISSEPTEVLRKKPTVTVHGCETLKGLSDISFTSIDKSRDIPYFAHISIPKASQLMFN
ncbi:uncharacterized protein LOC122643611 [Telopea speciosissima]|uniref:uncharacterized protein LOC122643611 n=1 Tax=Telopea speciosissima TaxID=54955 RepID=UPI001CC62003|nr:uncharacterized protein LOC122643611 [Telopea speciosissima]